MRGGDLCRELIFHSMMFRFVLSQIWQSNQDKNRERIAGKLLKKHCRNLMRWC